VPLRASQVPRPIFPRALPPPTPRSPTTALARCFVAGSRLHHSLADWPLLLCVTRPKRVRLRCGSRVRLARLRQQNYFHSRLLGYLSNGQFTRYPPFRILDRPGLSWHSKGAKVTGRGPTPRANARHLRMISAGVYPELDDGVEVTRRVSFFPNLASLRLGGRNIRIRASSAPGKFARAAITFNCSNTTDNKNTEFYFESSRLPYPS